MVLLALESESGENEGLRGREEKHVISEASAKLVGRERSSSCLDVLVYLQKRKQCIRRRLVLGKSFGGKHGPQLAFCKETQTWLVEAVQLAGQQLRGRLNRGSGRCDLIACPAVGSTLRSKPLFYRVEQTPGQGNDVK
jgi:hypothetical protein